MRLEWFLGWRYLRGSHNSTFISTVTLIATGGIVLGVAALVIVLGVMNGFDRELEDKIIGNLPILTVEKEGGINNYSELITELQKMEDVLEVYPFIEGEVLLRFGDKFAGALLKSPPEFLHTGKIPRGIILGGALARRLGAIPGESISIISAPTVTARKGKLKPRITECELIETFSSGVYEYDNSLAYVGLPTAQIIFEMNEAVSGLELKLTDIYLADSVANKIRRKIGAPFYIISWMEKNENLFSALRLEKTVMFIILTLIVLVAASNVASILTMIVIEKTKDIGILKAIGASSRRILGIFIAEGLLISISGIILGGGAGVGICRLLKDYPLPWLPRHIYPFEKLPIQTEPMDLVYIGAVTLILSLLASIYPALRASSLKPTKALRYE